MGCGSARWQQIADEIPMPGIASNTRAWILESLVLKPCARETHSAAIFDQERAIRGNEVGHRPSLPNVSMEPQAAFHRMDHPFTSKCELTIGTIGEPAVAIDRSAAHARAAAIAASVTGDPPFQR